MRWFRSAAPLTCPSCDEGVASDAAWCGACGARVVADDADGGDALDGGVAADPERDVSRWVTAVVLIGVIVAAVAAVALRPRPAEVLLGRAGNGTGITSSALPPPGLRLSWSHDLSEHFSWSAPGSLVVDGGLARIGGRVVDLDSGDVVGTAARVHGPSEGVELQLSGRELVIIDGLRGTVLQRAELPASVFDAPVWPIRRIGEVTFLGGDEGAVAVRDDGTVVADLPGWHESWDVSAPGDVAVALRSGRHHHGLPAGDLRLVSSSDGRTLLAREVDDDEVLVSAAVVGDRALVTSSPVTLPPDVEVPLQEVELVDATTGHVLARWEDLGHVAPRILGRSASGGTLLVDEHEDGADILEVAADGTGPVLRTTVPRLNWGESGSARGQVLPTAAWSEDGLLVELVTPERIVARTLEGEVLWERDVVASGTLRVDGGVVALLPAEPVDAPPVPTVEVQLLDLADGTPLGSVRTTPVTSALEWSARPAAVVNGAVAIAPRTGPATTGPADLGGARWIELGTGRIRTHTAVFEPWVEDRHWQPEGLVLAGLAEQGESGRREPIVVGGGVVPFRLLVGGAVVEHDLPELDRRPDQVEPVAATPAHVAVATGSWDDHGNGEWATHVIDRTSGSTLALHGVTGRFLTDDLLVGVEADPSGWAVEERLVAHDPSTGDLRWEGPLVPSRLRELLHDDDLAVVGDEFRRTAVALGDGSVPWSHAPDEELLPGGVLGPDHLLLATTTGSVYALDRDTGREVWRSDVGAPVTSLTGAGDGALVATLAADLVVLDGSGAAVQRIQLDEVALHAAALGDTVVVQHRDRVVGLHPDGAGHTADDEVELP